MGRDGEVEVMCDKSAYREPPRTALPKSAEQLMEEFNNLHKTGTYNAFLEDYVR